MSTFDASSAADDGKMTQAALCERDSVVDDCGVDMEVAGQEQLHSPAFASDIDGLRSGSHHQVTNDPVSPSPDLMGSDSVQDQARFRDIVRVLLLAAPLSLLCSAWVLERLAARRAASCSSFYAAGAKL